MVDQKQKIFSIKNELIHKSRESMLTAVQVFNNPNIQFKSESFIVLAIISWTYLLHAYYRKKGVEYRYYEQRGKRKFFDKTKFGAYKHWELEKCLNFKDSPVDKKTAANLRFLIGLRNEIEHQMTKRADDLLGGRFQACVINYNEYFKKLFNKSEGMDKYLSFSIQFSSISENQVEQLSELSELPKNISDYIKKFDDDLDDDLFNDSKFSYRVILVKKTVNRKGQADKVIEFIDPKSALVKGMNKEYWAIKDREKPKFRPMSIWKEMQELGFTKFGPYQHTSLWKKENAKVTSKGYGIDVEGTWYWYESWKIFVKNHCSKNKKNYS